MLRTMRSEASSDVLKVWLYAAVSVLFGAWISPLLYNAGKALAEVSSHKLLNSPIEWLAGICWSADFPAFFEFSMITAGLIFFLPFIASLRGGKNPESRLAGSVYLPEHINEGQRLVANPRKLRQSVVGFFLVTSLFLIIGGVLVLAGVLSLKNPGGSLIKLVFQGLAVAIGWAIFQEILFRGIAMGIFLRAMRPSAALGMSAVFFAFVHFLKVPPGMNVVDPDAAGVGFELLRKVASQFADGQRVAGTFIPLLALGIVFSDARWRTASLWLPIGLHAGWIFVSQLLGKITTAAGHLDSTGWLISSASLNQGLVPLLGILFAGVLANYYNYCDPCRRKQ